MCGRMQVDKDPVEAYISESFDMKFETETNDNLGPVQKLQMVQRIGSEYYGKRATWGHQPEWADRALHNARAETVESKPTFKKAFRERRCLIPCTGWYEWKDEGGARKQKYLFTSPKQSTYLMGAIWYITDDGSRVITLTTTANKKCNEIHDRMPVIINLRDAAEWLSLDTKKFDHLLKPISDDKVNIRKAA